MQRNTRINRKRLGHTINVRVDEDLYKKLVTRAEAMNMTTPGLNVTVSDVIRSMLIGLFDEISRNRPGQPAAREARRLKEQAERLVAETAKAERRDT